MGTRELKGQLKTLFLTGDAHTALSAVLALPAEKVINPLFSFFYDREPLIKWRAITLMGHVVAGLAEKRMEKARIIMRRLMWNLNDESGGIGWGAPEAMGEIMAQSPPLGNEYAAILLSYILPEGNYIEHPELQKGVLWGIGRLAQTMPQRVLPWATYLDGYITAGDAETRGLAIWIARLLGVRPEWCKEYMRDAAPFCFYGGWDLIQIAVAEMATRPLIRISSADGVPHSKGTSPS